MALSATARAKLDAMCAEAFRRLDILDEKLYDRGFLSKINREDRPTLAPMFSGFGSKPKGKGPSPLTVDKPEGSPIMPPSPVMAS